MLELLHLIFFLSGGFAAFMGQLATWTGRTHGGLGGLTLFWSTVFSAPCFLCAGRSQGQRAQKDHC